METIPAAPADSENPTASIGRLVRRITDAAASRTEQSRAYGEIVRRFQDMAFACAYALVGDTQLAEDAAQEAFLAAWRNLDSLREPEAFPGWFRCIVRTQCSRITRLKAFSTLTLDSLTLLEAPSASDPLHMVVRSEQQTAVRAALAALPEHERLAAILYYLDAWDQKEIAAFLDVPTTTVKKRLFSARKRLRERIAPLMFPHNDATTEAVRRALPADLPSATTQFADSVSLWTAVDTNDAETIRQLLARDPSLANSLSDTGETPLHLACAWGYVESAAALMDSGANPNADRASDGGTPLHALAAGSARLEILDQLLDRGAEQNTTNRDRRTAVQIAALRAAPLEEADADVFRLAETLLERGAVIDLWTAAALNRADAIPALAHAVNASDAAGDTPLHIAAKAGYRPVVKALLDAGAGIDAANAKGQTPLRLAVQPGQTRCCRRNSSVETVLRERGAKLDVFIAAISGEVQELAALLDADSALLEARDGDGATPLCLAAWSGQREAVTLLLVRGADARAADSAGNGPASVRYTPADMDSEIVDLLVSRGARMELRTALALGRAEAVEEMIRQEPAQVTAEVQDWAIENINDVSLTKRLFSPTAPPSMIQAAALGDGDTVARLLDEDPAGLHRRDALRETPLHRAAERGHAATVALLLERGASPNAVGGDGGTPLHRAASAAHAEIVSVLLTGGANVDAPNFRAETPLFGAVESGSSDTVRLLLEHGASVDTTATGQTTPLHLAAEQGDAAIVRLLVERGAKLGAKNHWGGAPLHLAAREGRAEAVFALLEAGADKTARDNWYRTPLHVACWFGQASVVELLLQAGVSVTELAYGYSTPLHTAAGAGQSAVAAQLLIHGADVNYPTDFKRTPLHDAVQSGSEEVVTLLLSHGANPNAANDRRLTPLHWAAAGGKVEIARRLREAGADITLRSGKNETPGEIALRYGNQALAEALS